MQNNNHKILFELIRKNMVVGTIEVDMSSKEGSLRFEINTSMDSYPMLSLESNHQQLNNMLLSYAKKDIIRCSVALDNSHNYDLSFEGEFYSTQIKGTSAPDSLELNVKSIHSFYRLSLFELSSEKNYDNISFRDFLTDILKIADINIEVYIEPKIADITIYGSSSNTNLFRMFKEICLIIEAAVRFNINNTVDIKSKASSLREFREQDVITVHKKDITSFTKFDNVLK